jgi:hypothetical protein
MKIINTVQPTKNKTAAESGSIKTPIFNQVSPVGNQLIEDAKGSFANSLALTAFQKMIMAPNQERKAALIATV